MPIYSVQSPSGEIFDVEGPEGATQEQAINMVRQNYGELKRQAYQMQVAARNKPTEERTTPWEDFKHGVATGLEPFDRLAVNTANLISGKGQATSDLEAADVGKKRKEDWGVGDYRKKTPGMSGEIINGVSQQVLTAPLKSYAAVANMAAQGIGSGMNTYDDLRRQGVDQKTALEVAGILGVSQGVSAALPAVGAASKHIGTAMLGAGATNATQNWGTNAAVYKLLRARGYADVAEKYNYGLEKGFVDLAVGALTGGMGRAIHPQPPEIKNTTPRVRELDAQQQAAKRAAAEGDAMARVSRNPREEYAQQRAYQQAQAENEQSMSPINPFRVTDPEAAAREMSQLQEIHDTPPPHQQGGTIERYGNEGAIGVVNPRALQSVLGSDERLPPDVQNRYGTPADGPPGVVNPRALDRTIEGPQEPPVEFRPGEDQNYGNGAPDIYAPARNGTPTEMEAAMEAANKAAGGETGPFSLPKEKAPEAVKPTEPPKVEIKNPVADKLVTGIMGEDRSLPGGTRKVDGNVAINRSPLLQRSMEDFEKVDADTAKERVLSGQYVDISKNRLKQMFTPGANVMQALTKNPVIAFLNTVWRDRETKMTRLSEYFISGKEGLPALRKALSPQEHAEAMQAMFIADRNAMDITPEQLAKFSPAQQKYIAKWKEAYDATYVGKNASNFDNGLPGFKARPGYFPSMQTDAYMAIVRDSKGDVVQILSENTKHNLNRLINDWKRNNRDTTVETLEAPSLQGVVHGFNNALMQRELLKLIGQVDPKTEEVIQKYYETVEALRNHKLFGQDKHELAKKGVPGFAGDKHWKTAEQNAEEMYKAGIQHLEDSFAFMTAQEAFAKINPFMKDADIVREMPNAVEYAQKYSKSAVGIINDGLVGHFGKGFNEGIRMAMQWSMLDRLGMNVNRGIKTASAMKTFVTWKLMGMGNLSFTEAQLIQPLQTVLPLIRTIASRNDGNTIDVVQSARKGTQAAMMGWVELMSGKKSPLMDNYDRAAFQYMREKGVAIFSEMERIDQATKSPMVKGAQNAAEFNMKLGEIATRPAAFMMFARALKDMAGNQYSDHEIFGIADNMTRMAMIDYSKQEKAMIFKDMGLAGNFAGALQTYKFGNLGQQLYLARNAVRKHEFQPMMYSVIAQAATAGVTGLWGFDTADAIVKYVSKLLGHPTTLRDLAYKHLPDWASLGVLSELQGGYIGSKFSAAGIAPGSVSDVFPHFKYMGKMMLEVAEAIGNGMQAADINRLLYVAAPESIRNGWAEDMFNRMGDSTLKRNKKEGYMEKNFQRTPEEWESSKGLFQLRPNREVKEATSLYAGKSKEMFYQDKRDAVIKQIINNQLNHAWTPGEFTKLKQQFMDNQGTEDEFNTRINGALGAPKGEGKNNVYIRRNMSERQRLQGDPATVNTPAEIRRYRNYE